MSHVVRRIGGELRTGRERQTVVPLNWDPSYLGSQKSLIPDLVIERNDTTVIVDAKYKEHWEDMQERRWTDLEEELRERHRADLLQVLAYSTVAQEAQGSGLSCLPLHRRTLGIASRSQSPASSSVAAFDRETC